MRISSKTAYACIAMLELAAHQNASEPLRIRKIADRHEIPQRFLVQILLQLKGAGLVASTRGASGGYQLTRSPDEISLREVIEVIEGPQEHVEEHLKGSSPAIKVLSSVWKEMASRERELLEEITFADLVERTQGRAEGMYYI